MTNDSDTQTTCLGHKWSEPRIIRMNEGYGKVIALISCVNCGAFKEHIVGSVS